MSDSSSSNLVAEIRRLGWSNVDGELVQKAADEIERLTAELAEVQRMRNAEMYPQPLPKVFPCPDCGGTGDRPELAEALRKQPVETSAGFCPHCGASIPHRLGEGRCPKCVHHRPKDEPVPPWEQQ